MGQLLSEFLLEKLGDNEKMHDYSVATDTVRAWMEEWDELENSGPQNINDIYPLTIVNMRFGNRLIIFNAPCDSDFVNTAEGDENVFFRIDEWLEDNVAPCLYGIGNTLDEAFKDYKKRSIKKISHD